MRLNKNIKTITVGILIAVIISISLIYIFIVTKNSPDIGLNQIEGYIEYKENGYAFFYPEEYKIAKDFRSVRVYVESDNENDENALIITPQIDPSELSIDNVLEIINKKKCSEIATPILQDIFREIKEIGYRASFVYINGIPACQIEFNSDNGEGFIWSLAGNDNKYYALAVFNTPNKNSEVYSTLQKVALSFKINSNIKSENMNQTNQNSEKYNKYSSVPETLDKNEMANKKSIITTDKGVIEIELFGEEAPITVSNHIFLVNEEFYNGLIFHRREEGFVIQGGDPLGSGIGGPGYKFEDEPVKRNYDKGIVAMANSGPNTNGSQFFIMLEDYPLPPSYTIFGKVIKGMDVVEKIEVGDVMNKVEIVDAN